MTKTLDTAIAQAMNKTRSRVLKRCRNPDCGKPFAALLGQDYHAKVCRRKHWYDTHYQPTGRPPGPTRKN